MNLDKKASALTKALANVLRQHRENLDLSKTRLAQKAGLAFQTVAFIENAERRPTIETLARLALVMETTPSALIKEAEKACKL